MSVITLTTEWKPNDFYYGIIKGKICSLCPGTQIIDNAGNIPAFNLAHASFVIRNTYNNYPKGSVHIICVHSEAHKDQDYLLVKFRDHFFVGTDNGIFNLILNSEPDEIIKIDHEDTADELEVFALAASRIIMGEKPENLGTHVNAFSERIPLRATIDKNFIIGSVIFIDSYGNAISNITREVFDRVFDKRPFKILVQSNNNCTDSISQRYSDVSVGDMLARFNQLDLLEIAINGADVSELFSLSIGSVVRIDFTEKSVLPDHLF